MLMWKFFQLACALNLKKDFSHPSPILFVKTTSGNSNYDLVLPFKSNGEISLDPKKETLLTCPNSKLKINSLEEGETLTTKCFNNSSTNDEKLNVSCLEENKPFAVKTGKKCLRYFDEYSINVNLPRGKKYEFLKICFDPTYLRTLYVKHVLHPQIFGAQSGKRPSHWVQEQLFDLRISLNKQYKKRKHFDTLNKILKKDMFVEHNNSYYLTKGHLSPFADHVYDSLKSLTFHYLNAVPQWNNLNSENWRILESRIRNFVSKRSSNLLVFTGSYEVAALPDADGKLQNLYLYLDGNNNGAVPVPKLLWKILYDPDINAGVVLIGINNPFLLDNKTDFICEDICDRLQWLNMKKRKNVDLGYIYCCEVNDFKRQADYYFPKEIQVANLLLN